METIDISVRLVARNYEKNGSFESVHFSTNLPPEHFSSENAVDIVNEQMMPQIFTTFRISASGFAEAENGWSFNLTPSSSDTKKLIKSLPVGSEWTVEVEVEAPPDFELQSGM